MDDGATATVHPVAYSIFPWNDAEEEKAARALW